MVHGGLEEMLADYSITGCEEFVLDCAHLAYLMQRKSEGMFGRDYFERMSEIANPRLQEILGKFQVVEDSHPL